VNNASAYTPVPVASRQERRTDERVQYTSSNFDNNLPVSPHRYVYSSHYSLSTQRESKPSQETPPPRRIPETYTTAPASQSRPQAAREPERLLREPESERPPVAPTPVKAAPAPETAPTYAHFASSPAVSPSPSSVHAAEDVSFSTHSHHNPYEQQAGPPSSTSLHNEKFSGQSPPVRLFLPKILVVY
jgi:hypothetical protein